MTFLPIVARELRVASRRRATYWVRTAAATSVIALGTFFFLMMQHEGSTPHEIAQVLFGILTGSAILYSLFSGVGSTADCLSEEKREGTFGLLFLTDLKGYDVVLGKLAASSLNGIYGMMAVVPMLAVPLLMGGVTPGEFGRMALVAVNTLFFSLALGIFVSAMSRSARKAMAITFGILVIITAALPLYALWTSFVARTKGVEPLLLRASAGRAYFLAWDLIYKTKSAQEEYWRSLATMHALGWVCLCLASLTAPRTWQDKPVGAQRLRWRERWRFWSYGDLAERSAFRRRLLKVNPFFWLAARARLKPAYVWAVLGLMASAWAWGLAKLHREWLDLSMYMATGWALSLLLKAWVASEAGRQIAEDRKQGALELLLSTPLTIHEILRGQLLALKRQFLGPLLVTLVVGFVFMLAPLKEAEMDGGEGRTTWVCFWLGGMTLLLADLVALYWVGMWQALTARNPVRAVTANLLRIMVLPTVAFSLLCLIRALWSIRGDEGPGWQFFLGSWVGLGLATDLFFSLAARQKLLTEFRAAATQRFVRRVRSPKQPVPAGDVPPIFAVQK